MDIKMDNAAFDPPGDELSRLLRKAADQIEGRGVYANEQPVHDINGNNVGNYKIIGRR